MHYPTRTKASKMTIRHVTSIAATAAVALGMIGGAAAPALAVDHAAKSSQTTVNASATAVATGILLAAGDSFSLSTTGVAQYRSDSPLERTTCDTTSWTDSDGNRLAADGQLCAPYSGKWERNLVLTSAPAGALLARIGDGEWFAAGSNFTGTASTEGELVLAYNDVRGLYKDNRGAYTTTVNLAPEELTTHISVDAAPSSVVSDITFEVGDQFEIDATGVGRFWNLPTIEETNCNTTGYTTADGSRIAADGRTCSPYFGKWRSSLQLPSAPAGALLARIGDGEWFAVGSHITTTAANAGALTLAYNDVNTMRSDNGGSYDVAVTLAP